MYLRWRGLRCVRLAERKRLMCARLTFPLTLLSAIPTGVYVTTAAEIFEGLEIASPANGRNNGQYHLR
jgi:hypothetical protein